MRAFKNRVPDDPYSFADEMGWLKSNADKDRFFEKLHTVFERAAVTKIGGRKTRQNKRNNRKNQTRRR